MPKMTRQQWLDAISSYAQTMRANFERDGRLTPAIFGWDQMGRHIIIMGMSADASADDKDFAIKQGVQFATIPFRDHLDEVEPVLHAARCVAAAHISETWIAHGERAQELIRAGKAPSEAESPQEGVFIFGTWPRQHAFLALHRSHPRG